MHLDIRERPNITTHEAEDACWCESNIFWNGQLMHHVVALNTTEGWLLRWLPNQYPTHCKYLGVIEFYRRGCTDQ